MPWILSENRRNRGERVMWVTIFLGKSRLANSEVRFTFLELKASEETTMQQRGELSESEEGL